MDSDSEEEWTREQLGEMDLEKECRDRNLKEFLNRVTNGRRTPPSEAGHIFLEMLDKMTVEEKKMNFSALVVIFVLIENDDLHLDLFKSIIKKLLKTTEEFGPDHSSYCVELIETYNSLALDYLWSDGYVLYFATNEDVDYILRCCSMERSDGSGMRSTDILMQCLTLAYVVEEKSRLSHLFLYYGFPYSFDEEWFQQVFESVDNWCCLAVKGVEQNNWFSSDMSRKGNLRLQMALEILTFSLAYKWERRYYDKTECELRLLWNSVPYPFISATEMIELLSPFYTGTRFSLEEVCEEYVNRNTIYSVPKTPEPRSLQHLARVQVRKNMIHAHTISKWAIDSLPIPSTLKTYVELDYLLKKPLTIQPVNNATDME